MSAPDSNPRLDRFWDRQSAAFSAALILVAASRLVLTDWTPFLTLTQTLGFLGAALGFALGYSIYAPRAARWFAFAYGLILIPSQLLKSIERTEHLYEDLWTVLTRLFDALVLLFKSQPVYDPLFFLTLVSVGFWCVGLYSGFQLTRSRNFLGVIVPSGVVMLVVQVYDAWAPLRAWVIALYIFLSLLLLGRLYYLENKNIWKQRRVFFTADMEGDISRIALASAAIVIVFSWSFPSVLNSVEPAAKAWSRWTRPVRDWLSDAVSALDSPYRNPSNVDFYGETLALGGSAPTSTQPVFYVKVDKAPEVESVRYYWRGRIYDQYINGRWVTSSMQEERFAPSSDRLQTTLLGKRYDARFTVSMNFPKQELMYLSPGALWVDRPGYLMLGAGDGINQDVMAWKSDPVLIAGDKYRIRALIANPSEEQLRAAGENYPEWIRARYLQVPPELQPRLSEIARRVTASQTNPYDKAQAVTDFLRGEISYTLKLEQAPPSGYDPVLWVLLEYKKGFCMYSASAEVLMLRSLGIPARMVVGFAQGQYDTLRGRYTVARVDSHAWPEVYFPNVGWVEFEPTGNQAPLTRPRQPLEELSREEQLDQANLFNPTPNPNTPEKADSQVEESSFTARLVNALLPVLYSTLWIGIFALAVFFAQRYAVFERLPVYLESRYVETGHQPPKWLQRWAMWATLQPIQRAFHAVDLSLRWLNHILPAHATPRERANALAGLLPQAQDAISTLCEEHESALFTNRGGDLERARRASRKILLETWRLRFFKGTIESR